MTLSGDLYGFDVGLLRSGLRVFKGEGREEGEEDKTSDQREGALVALGAIEKDAGNPGHAAQYEKNLVHFIKTVRKEFNAPNAKFVLATMGESAKGGGGGGGQILDAQLAVDGASGKHPEFKGNVATIYTNPMAQGGSGNSHYGGKAEVYMDVGEAMGRAMVELLKTK